MLLRSLPIHTIFYAEQRKNRRFHNLLFLCLRLSCLPAPLRRFHEAAEELVLVLYSID